MGGVSLGSWSDTLRVGGGRLGAGRQEQGGTGKQEQGEAGRGWGSRRKSGVRMPKSTRRDGKMRG